MRLERGRVMLLLCAVVLVTSACAEPPEVPPVGLTGGWETAGCEFNHTPSTSPSPVPSTWPAPSTSPVPSTPPALDAAMGRIDKSGRTDYRDSYAGLEVDQQRVRAVVYRVPSAEFDEVIRLTADNTCIVVRDALHGIRELSYWHDRVVADLPMWQAKGLRIETVGARHDGFGVEIGTRDLDRARIDLPAHYGTEAPLIFIEQGPIATLAGTGPAKLPQPPG